MQNGRHIQKDKKPTGIALASLAGAVLETEMPSSSNQPKRPIVRPERPARKPASGAMAERRGLAEAISPA
ncbi:hypothetical protein FAI40_04470 [Acetobacteraceae bacterium]|nr:hypothetical protein FAI40_04470 [Acetobacteraceae bacterium]